MTHNIESQPQVKPQPKVTSPSNLPQAPAGAIEHKPRIWQRLSFRSALHAIVIYSLIIGIGTAILMPLSWMITASLRGEGEVVFTIPVAWIPTESFHFENFWYVLNYPSYPLWRPTLNSIHLVALNIIGVVISNTMVGYTFARLRFPGRDLLFKLVILTMLLPGIVLMIPSFLLFNTIGWYGTYLPLWVPSFFGSAFFIFITRQYMRSFPRELDDASRIDGCGFFGTYWRIILPLSKPVLVVMAIFTFVDVWNDFQGPLIYLNDADKFTLAIALDYFRRSTFSTATTNTVNYVMAASLMSIVPLLALYFAAQKQLIGGIASVGLKG
jgi:ABC-type glycerol-3-phosphate transport system permease component